MQLKNLVEAYLLKLRFNLKSEASKNYLNYAWWVLEPAMFVAVFYVVFDVLMQRGGEDFVVFLLLGNVPFLWFSRSVSNSATSIIGGRGLIQQMAIPKAFFPLLIIGQDLVKQCVVFVCLLTFIIAMGFAPQIHWLGFPLLVITQLLFITASALVVSAIVPLVPDIRFIVQTGMMMLMFASGVFYDYRKVLIEEHVQVFLLNPLARLIDAYRDVLMRGGEADWTGIMVIAAVSALVVALMLVMLRKKDATYARLVIQ